MFEFGSELIPRGLLRRASNAE